MDIIASAFRPDTSFSAFFSRSGESEPGNKSPSASTQHVELPNHIDVDNSDDSSESTSASSFSNEAETVRKDVNCDKMIEKWRLVRLSDRQKAQKKIYRTDDVHTALFGKNYSKFYSAFRQGTTPTTPKPTAITVPSKRPAVASEPVPKRRRVNDRASLLQSDQHHPQTTPPRRSAVVTMKLPGPKLTELASPSKAVGKFAGTPRPRSHSETKEQSSKRRGVGLYAGNWEYATNEEIVPEYLSVAEKIADLEGRTTRRAFAKMTSGEVAGDSGKNVALSSGKEARKSGRARNMVDYTRLSLPEDNYHEITTPEQIEESRMSPVQRANEMSPSTSVSSTSSRSTLLPNNPSRSTSKSTATNTEQSERPNRSWNAIVYEILATSDGPLTFPQLVQSIKNRYPFFNSSSQDKVLKSGPKNPLYFHEAFCRDEVVNGKQAWALKPGEFLDKKTGEVLTPQPRYTVSSPRNTQQTYEAEDWTPGDSTLRSSHSFNPGSSIPRFGREILNSPEIPDSQDAGVITPSPQEKDSRIVTEQSPHLEHAYQQTPPIVRNIANEVTDAAESAFAAVSNGASPSGRSPQSHLQRATTNGSSTSTTPYGQSPVAAGAKSQSILQRVDTVDYKPSGTGSHSPTAFQASQPFGSSTTTSSSPSIISSTGENGNGSNSITTQPASTSTPPVHAVSPTQVTTSLEGRAAISELPAFTPAAAKPSVTTLPSMLLDGTLVDGKDGSEETYTPPFNDGSQVSVVLPSLVR